MDNINISIKRQYYDIVIYLMMFTCFLKKFKQKMLRNHSVICKGIIVCFDASKFCYAIVFIILFQNLLHFKP